MSEILNVEIKAKCQNPIQLHEKLISLGAEYKGKDHQIDTYFHCQNGRLKLRSGNIENSLIFYKREDKAESKESQIVLDKLTPGHNIKDVLTASYGISVEVDKLRGIYFIDNVKFHIDEVKGLGSFMEIEAIDETGAYGFQRIKEQCNDFIEKLGIKTKDFIEVSYSDLLGENFENKINREARYFMKILKSQLSDFCLSSPDHLCYRVESNQEYEQFKDSFMNIGELLVESQVGGRLISTFKLNNPIEFEEWSVDIVELPAPKVGSHYELGFEHAEFVISETFDTFKAQYQGLDWDLTAMDKKHNPELRLKLAEQISVKFHHQSLEDVIKIEKEGLNS